MSGTVSGQGRSRIINLRTGSRCSVWNTWVALLIALLYVLAANTGAGLAAGAPRAVERALEEAETRTFIWQGKFEAAYKPTRIPSTSFIRGIWDIQADGKLEQDATLPSGEYVRFYSVTSVLFKIPFEYSTYKYDPATKQYSFVSEVSRLVLDSSDFNLSFDFGTVENLDCSFVSDTNMAGISQTQIFLKHDAMKVFRTMEGLELSMGGGSSGINGGFSTISSNMVDDYGLWPEGARATPPEGYADFDGVADPYTDLNLWARPQGLADPYKLVRFSWADFNGDGATDVAAFHLPTDQFFTDYAGNLGQFGWGGSDSMPLIWDYDGDGKTDVSIYHIPTNQWFVKGVGNLGQYGWGGEDSIPVPGDYNGDGQIERAFYHSPTNRWFVEGQDPVTFGWNGAECIPLPGDYDGDGKTDMVIYHIPSNQWFQYGVGNLGQFGWGGADCIPVPGDYNGDGVTDIAVYHVPTNQWFVKGMGNLGQYGWGGLESFPIPGDYDGDGVTERGFYRHGENWWFIEGESDFVWGWGGSEFMPITSSIAVYNWFRFMLHKFE